MCSPPWGEVEVGVFGGYTTAVGLVFGGTTLSSGAVILAAVVLVAGEDGTPDRSAYHCCFCKMTLKKQGSESWLVCVCSGAADLTGPVSYPFPFSPQKGISLKAAFLSRLSASSITHLFSSFILSTPANLAPFFVNIYFSFSQLTSCLLHFIYHRVKD